MRRSPPPFLKSVHTDAERLAGRDRYPFDLPFVRDLSLTFDAVVTIIVGDNGSGKSTLLEALAELAGFPGTGGSRAHTSTAAADDRRLEAELDEGARNRLQWTRREDSLASVLRAAWLPKTTDGFFFRAESFFDVARYLDAAWAIAPRRTLPPLHLRRSHAEGFLHFFDDRLARVLRDKRPSLFLFDEPESALAPQRQIAFLKWLRRVEGSRRGQVILATHSPVLMAYPGAALLHLRHGRLAPARLEDLDHFTVLADFFADPRGFVARGLADP